MKTMHPIFFSSSYTRMISVGIIIAIVVVILIIITIIVVAVYASRATASETSSTDSSEPTQVGYGIGSSVGCDSGVCMLGSVSAKGAACRALSGTMTGTPGDTEWTNCELGFGPSHAMGILPYDTDVASANHYVAMHVSADDCAALGGRMNGNGTLCHLGIGANPRYRFYGHGGCPSGKVCKLARINASSAAQCSAIGGLPTDPTATGPTLCSLDIGPV